MKTYPAYKDSGVEWIGEIPEEWEVIKLGYLSEMIVPMRDKPKDLSGDIPWLRIEDFDSKYVYKSKSDQGVSQETVDCMNLKIFPINTVLCTCSCNMGKTAIVKKPLITNQTFIGIISKINLFYEYLYQILFSSSAYLNSISTGAIQTYLSKEDFQKMKIPLPPISEQKQIACFLDKKTAQIDELISKKKDMIELLKEERTSVINQAVTKGINPNVKMKDSGIEWLSEIPEHWVIKKLGGICYIKGRIGWQGLKQSEFTENGPYLITGMNFKNGRINWNDVYHITEERYQEAPEIHLKLGDVLMTKDGTIGKLLYVDFLPDKASLNSHLLVLRPLNKEFIPLYLYYQLESNLFNIYIELNKTGTTFFGITQDSVSRYKMLLPPISEQKEIVTHIDKETKRIDTIISRCENEIELLQEYRTALISEAVTGKIDLREEII